MNHLESNFFAKTWVQTIFNILSSLTVMIILTLIVYFIKIPNPNMILISGVTVATALFGITAGIPCGIEMIVFSMYYFSNNHNYFEYTEINLYRLIVIIVGTLVSILTIGVLRYKHAQNKNKLELLNKKLEHDNLDLKAISYVDPLTKTKNRYAFREEMPSLFGQDVILMILDIDDFKQINDQFGHPCGDDVLSHFGDFLVTNLGQESCFRYGGDEFLIVKKSTTLEEFEVSLDKLKNEIESFRSKQGFVPLHFSCGIVKGSFQNDDELVDMMNEADKLLYQSKKQGKDTWSIVDHSNI